jgi:ABC-2 type transport system permease protein
MVAEFLKLKLRILGNSFLRSPRQNLGVVLALLACVVLAIVSISTLVSLRSTDPETARTTVIIGGSVVIAAFLVVPLLSGVGDTLDPRRFALFAIPSGRLALALTIAGLLTVPVLLFVITSFFSIATWSTGFGTGMLALLSALIAIATAVLGSRVMALLAALGLSNRRSRDVAAIAAVLLVVIVLPAIVLWASLNDGRGNDALLHNAADVLSWTPLGAVWAFPADAVLGDPAVILKLLIALAFVAVLWFAWRGLVHLVTVSTQRENSGKEAGKLGWFGRTPSTRSGAVAARSLTYWARDARYPVPVVGVFIFLLVAYVTFLVVGIPLTILILLTIPALCITLALAVHNDVSLDNSAVWLHVAAGRLGIADRLGRAAPILLIGIPLIAIGSVASAFFANNFDALPALLGVSTCLLFGGLGVGNFLSAIFPYPAVRPGDSPFAQPQSGGGMGTMVQIGFVVLTFVLAAPAIVYGILGLLGESELYWASLWWGAGLGLAGIVAGTVFGGKIFDRRGPEILAAALRN